MQITDRIGDLNYMSVYLQQYLKYTKHRNAGISIVILNIMVNMPTTVTDYSGKER